MTFRETPFFVRTKHAQLSAMLHRAPGKKLVIMCHGFTGQKVEAARLFMQTARALSKAGLNALRFDFMGSGESSGEFQQMTPGSQIRDALDVLAWGQRRYAKVAFLGMSFGGGTSILASHAAKRRPDALLTWCAVPDVDWWRATMIANKPDPKHPNTPGRRFWSERLKTSVGHAYTTLDIPRLQIQGDRDIPGFRERFAPFCPGVDKRARQMIIPGADHCFMNMDHRRRAIAESVRWLKQQLA